MRLIHFVSNHLLPLSPRLICLTVYVTSLPGGLRASPPYLVFALNPFLLQPSVFLLMTTPSLQLLRLKCLEPSFIPLLSIISKSLAILETLPSNKYIQNLTLSPFPHPTA